MVPLRYWLCCVAGSYWRERLDPSAAAQLSFVENEKRSFAFPFDSATLAQGDVFPAATSSPEEAQDDGVFLNFGDVEGGYA